MKFIHASDVAREKIERFLQHNDQINLTSLLQTGYVVMCEEEIIGCFSLEPIEHDAYWLNQLYVIRNEAVKLPVIVEAILAYAKECEAKVIYAHSEQPVTDLLLQSLRFSLETQADTVTLPKHKKGHWWTYSICS